MLIAPPEALVNALKPWSDYYGHSKMMESIVTFLHIGGLLMAGGLAIAADRGTFRALRLPVAERSHFIRELNATHRWVLVGLGFVVVSGLALLGSDLETFWGSWIYWTKMALVVVLLVNGYGITRTESALERDASDASPAWRTLRRTSVTSLVLWFSITALGCALVNFS
jgi:hypothetical protein